MTISVGERPDTVRYPVSGPREEILHGRLAFVLGERTESLRGREAVEHLKHRRVRHRLEHEGGIDRVVCRGLEEAPGEDAENGDIREPGPESRLDRSEPRGKEEA